MGLLSPRKLISLLGLLALALQLMVATAHSQRHPLGVHEPANIHSAPHAQDHAPPTPNESGGEDDDHCKLCTSLAAALAFPEPAIFSISPPAWGQGTVIPVTDEMPDLGGSRLKARARGPPDSPA